MNEQNRKMRKLHASTLDLVNCLRKKPKKTHSLLWPHNGQLDLSRILTRHRIESAEEEMRFEKKLAILQNQINRRYVLAVLRHKLASCCGSFF